jgi:hypothetical protein
MDLESWICYDDDQPSYISISDILVHQSFVVCYSGSSLAL